MKQEIDWSALSPEKNLTDLEKALIREIATRFLEKGTGTPEHDKRVELGKERHLLNELVAAGFLRNVSNKYYPTFPSLFYVRPELRSVGETIEALLFGARYLYSKGTLGRLTLRELITAANDGSRSTVTDQAAHIGAQFLRDFPIYFSNSDGSADQPVSAVHVTDNILDFESLAQTWEDQQKRHGAALSAQRSQPKPESRSVQDTKRIFVIHGRDERLRQGVFDFLRALDLDPIEWSQAIALTGKAAPYVGEVLDAAFSYAQAVVVVFSPDDMAWLRPDLRGAAEPAHETRPTYQARPNVLFESGMAMARHPTRTVLVEIGPLRPFSDIGGRHTIRMDNSTKRRQELAQRLRDAGCPVNLDRTDWQSTGDMRAPELAVPPELLPSERLSNQMIGAERELVADVVSELEDNLEMAKAPRVGDSYRRPSSQIWKSHRNKLTLPDSLRYSLASAYRQIDGWSDVVESGVHPNHGSLALNTTTSSLLAELPGLIEALKKL